MNDTYAYGHNNALGAAGQPVWSAPPEESAQGNVGLAVCIWIPTVIAGAVMIKLGMAVPGLILVAVVAVLHSLIQPRVAVYTLLFVIPVEWSVMIVEGMTTMSKLVGVLALFVSLPRLVPAVTRGRWDPSAKWLVLLIGWTGVSCIWAMIPSYSFMNWISMLLIWSIPLLIIVHCDSRATWRMFMLVFMAGGLACAALILLTSDIGQISSSAYARAQGMALVGESAKGQTNIPARVCAAALFISIFFVVTVKGQLRRIGLVAAIVLLAVAILMLKGRSVYIATFGALVAGVMMLKGAGLAKRVVLTAVFFVIGAIVMFSFVKLGLLGKGVEQRIASIGEEGVEAGRRFDYWMAHIDAFFATGFRGRGFHTMELTAESGYHVAHSDIFAILGEMGIIGIIAFLGLHIHLFRRMRRLDDIWIKMFCLMSWTFLIVAGLAGNDFTQKYYTIVFAFILAGIRITEAERAQHTLWPGSWESQRPPVGHLIMS